MAAYALPALYAVLVWWFSTGLILLLDHRPRTTHGLSMLAGTGVLALALWAIGTSAGNASETGAYTAFTGGLLVWGWQEMSYYMGYLSGPRPSDARRGRRASPASARRRPPACGTRRPSSPGPRDPGPDLGPAEHLRPVDLRDPVGMNLSARLNLFLGVRNLNAEFLPEHLAYLQGYLRVRAMNPLFPVSVGLAALGTAALALSAASDGATAHEVAGLSILATLMALATLEHGFLMLPLPSSALWQWSLPKVARSALPAPVPSAGGEGERP